MRILHITDHYPPVLGGIETHVSTLAQRQAARGDEVVVLTCGPSSLGGEHAVDSGPVSVRRVHRLSLAAAVDLRGFDICHAHLSVVAPFTAPLAALARRRGTPTLVTVHSLWNGMGPVPAVAAALAGLWAAPVLWTAVSAVAAEQLAGHLPRRPQVRVLPNAVDVDPRPRSPRPDGGNPVRLVSTMRIARRKRPLALARVFDRLQDSTSRPVHLTIVGDGPQRQVLERRLRRLGLSDSVRLTGRLHPAQVLAEVARADAYVAPARLESFGIAALEARCLGLPVVGHATSGLSGFIRDGVEGWLCGSDSAMVDTLHEVVEEDELRLRISEHNRTTPSGLTWQHALERHDRVYAIARGERPRTYAAPDYVQIAS